jgi:hypothetical protein
LLRVAYEADTLPEDDPVSPWTPNQSCAEPAAATVEGGVLTVSAPPNCGVAYDRKEDALARASAFALQARLWLESSEPESWISEGTLGAKDGAKYVTLHFMVFEDTGRRFMRLETLNAPLAEVDIDWRVPHVYRLEVVREETARVFVDGVLVIERPYQDLEDTQPGEEGFGLSQFGTGGSVMHWDWVRYELCPADGGSEEPPSMAEQVARMQAEAAGLEASRPIAAWLERRLERAAEEEDPGRQATELLEIGRHLFVLRRAGVISGEAGRLEALLDFGRLTAAPEVERTAGYLGRVEIAGSLVKSGGVVPGVEDGHLRLFVRTRPWRGLPWGRRPALVARAGVVRVATGELIRFERAVVELEQGVFLGAGTRVQEVDLRWDGFSELGEGAVTGQEFVLVGSVEQVELAPSEERVAWLHDQAGDWTRLVPLPRNPLEETAARRWHDTNATRVGWEDFELSAGRYQLATEGALGQVDPVVQVMDRTSGEFLAAGDECAGLDNWVSWTTGPWWNPMTFHVPLPVRCEDEAGSEISCPQALGTKEACVALRLPEAASLRAFFHAAGNGRQGVVVAGLYERRWSPGDGQVVYRRVQRWEGVSAGGTFVRFEGGWGAGDEIDVLAPSPERCMRAQPGGFHPSAYPILEPASVFVMDSRARMAGPWDERSGLLGGARLSGVPGRPEGGLLLVGGSEPSGGNHVCATVLINDAGSALERDADGLGELLEADLGLDPDNPDTDGDGLWDGFEVLGIRGAGLYPDQALPSWGADPRHKDVFVENDYREECDSNSGECAAPLVPFGARHVALMLGKCSGGPGFLGNPDGQNGLSLHIDNGWSDERTSVHGDWGGVNPISPSDPDAGVHLLPIRRGVFIHGVSVLAGGAADKCPTIFFATRPAVETAKPGNVFMHELGHCLGIGHHGDKELHPNSSRYSWKPHYVSVMNPLYTGGSPNQAAGLAWDPDNLRFSEAERLMIYRSDGSSEVFELNPAAIDEGQMLPFVRRHAGEVHTLHDLGSGQAWYGLETDDPVAGRWVMVDWDRSGAIETQSVTRADVLGHATGAVSQFIPHEASLRFGPQLASYKVGSLEEHLYLFYVLEGGADVRYQVFREEPGCDPEQSPHELEIPEPACMHLADSGVIELGGAPIASEMSAVSTPVEGVDHLFLFYRDTVSRLCVVHRNPGPGPAWLGPACGEHGFAQAPEAVAFKGALLVFGVGPGDAGAPGAVKLVVFEPTRWSDIAVSEPVVVLEDMPGGSALRSSVTPGVAVDPGEDLIVGTQDDSLHGILVDESSTMRLFQGPGKDAQGHDVLSRYERLDDDRRWLDQPRGTYRPMLTEHRPALAIERHASAPHAPRWTVWYHPRIGTNPSPWSYWRITSSFESPPEGGEQRPVLSVINFGSPESLRSLEDQNVSLSFYRGKLRAAVAFDRRFMNPWHPYQIYEHGYMLFPVADGIFQARLRDSNDLDTIRRNLARSVLGKGLFDGLTPEELDALQRANRVVLPAELLRPSSIPYHYLFPSDESHLLGGQPGGLTP